MGADSLINLHTHTVFSDGALLPEDVVERAVEGGLTHVAISDHFETIKVRSLRAGDLERYVRLIRSLGRKYGDGISVLAGVEIESVEPTFACDDCNVPYEAEDRFDPCPRCGGNGGAMIAGDEMMLTEIDVEDGDGDGSGS